MSPSNYTGYIGRNPGDTSEVVARQNYEPSGIQTSFTFSSGYTIGYIDCYLNGVRLVQTKDYSATNGTTVGLVSYANSGDIVELVAYKAFNATALTDATGNFTVGQKLTVSGISSLTDVVSSGIVTADSFSGGWSGALSVTDTTASTSTSTGALIVSGGVGIGKSLFIGEGISVGGTITYNDVTNVDSVGIVTAGKGFRATTGGLIVTAGVSTLSPGVDGLDVKTGNFKVTAGIASIGAGVTISSDFIHLGDNKKIQLGIASDLTIQHNATNSVINNTTGQLRLAGDDVRIMNKDEDETYATFANDGAATLYYDNSKIIETVSSGASVYGALKLQNGLLRENVNRNTSAAANAATALNLDDGMVHWFTTNLGAANVKMNIVSGVGINTDMAIGDMITVTIMTKVNSSSNFIEQLRVDGVEASAGVTTYWTGGSAPSDGGDSGVDTYAFSLVKTGNAAYDMVANQVKGS